MNLFISRNGNIWLVPFPSLQQQGGSHKNAKQLAAGKRGLFRVVELFLVGLLAVLAALIPASAWGNIASVTKSFSPSTIAFGGTSTLTITIVNRPPGNPSNIAFTDSYPAGILNAATPALSNSCGGTATAAAGGGSLALSGGDIRGNSSCTISVTVSATAAGTYSNSTGTVSSNAGSGTASATLTVNKASQTISVTTAAPASAAYNSQFTVAATASSGLPVAYSSGSPSVCTNSGATFTMIASSGTCVVQYDQAGDGDYNAAPQVTNNVSATGGAGGGVDHFLLATGAATASTCTPKNVSITVMDAANNVVTSYTGTVNITTAPAHGDWSTVSAAGTLTPGGADSGTATYQFAAGDNGVVTLALSDQHADAALTISVVDSLVPASNTTSSSIAFSDNAFVLTNDTVQVAGRPQAMSAAMWRKDPSTGVCAVSPYYTGAKNLKAWLTRDISDPGGAAPKIGAVSLPGALPGANNLTLTFAAGTANFSLSTTDVGKYALNLRDDSLSFGGAVINGSSPSITTRPFALVVSAIKQGATNNPAVSSAAGAVFAKAGSGFQATVGAYLWNSAADTNVAGGDGVPDASATLALITANGAAPSYTWPTTLSAGTPYTPAGGTLGALSNGVQGGAPCSAPNCFTNGIATPTNLNYAEVGSFTLGVAATSYLNTPGVDLIAANGTALVFDNTGARNGVVGRFVPDHFNTYVLSLLGLPMLCPPGLTCPVSYNGLVYSGEPFSVQVIAQNAANATTLNYDATLGFSKAVTLSAWNAVGGATPNPNGGTLGASAVASTAFVSGSASVSTPNYSLPNVTAPTNVYLRALDTDGVTSLLAVPANSVEGGVGVANGRLRLFNSFGSEKASLGLNVQAQYWSGNSWVLSSTDSTTTIPATSVALSNYRDHNGDATAAWTTSASGPGTLALGQGSLTLSAPVPAGSTGCVDVAINLGTGTQDSSCLANHPVMTAPASSLAWLRGQNGSCAASASYTADPSATACFGVYAPETQRTIHVRELF